MLRHDRPSGRFFLRKYAADRPGNPPDFGSTSRTTARRSHLHASVLREDTLLHSLSARSADFADRRCCFAIFDRSQHTLLLAALARAWLRVTRLVPPPHALAPLLRCVAQALSRRLWSAALTDARSFRLSLVVRWSCRTASDLTSFAGFARRSARVSATLILDGLRPTLDPSDRKPFSSSSFSI